MEFGAWKKRVCFNVDRESPREERFNCKREITTHGGVSEGRGWSQDKDPETGSAPAELSGEKPPDTSSGEDIWKQGDPGSDWGGGHGRWKAPPPLACPHSKMTSH